MPRTASATSPEATSPAAKPLATAEAPARAPVPKLSTGPSLLLDLVRLAAAVTVAAGHLSQSTFSTGWHDLTLWSVNAVTLFFVLSGFVIRYVTLRRTSTLGSYATDRYTRLYSVLVPAMLFTAASAAWVYRLRPSQAVGVGSALQAAVINLMMFSDIWHRHVVFLTDGPMWSLCYESFYYMLYGLAFYLRGWRRMVCVAAVAALAGPEVLLVLPVWLAGCWLFAIYARARNHRSSLGLAAAAAALLAVAALHWHTEISSVVDAVRLTQFRSHAWWMPSPRGTATVAAYPWGAGFAVALLVGLLAADRLRLREHGLAARTIRVLAEGTYPLYLFHLPLFVLVVTLLGHPVHSQAARLGLLAAAVAGAAGLGHACDLLKLATRRWLKGAGLAVDTPPGPSLDPALLKKPETA